ncbi:MAG: hypothetical protein KC505_11100 [Myxococcales bacterium]|nr:hypothetical protein [Myxococcales bacterium]
MKLFDRIIELKVGDTNIKGLDIAFEIEKDESPEPNPCHIDIFNLNPTNRTILAKYQKVPVLLKAGFKDGVGVIFHGDMMRCNNSFEQASWKTTLACGEGLKESQKNPVNKTFAKGTPLKTVINELTGQIEICSGDSAGLIAQIDGDLTRSYSISGNPYHEVKRILASKNLLLSIQNNLLQIRAKTKALSKSAISLSADTGLLSSPEINSKHQITVRALLMADYQPGRLIYLDTKVFRGHLIIKKVNFNGANFGDNWEAKMECEVIS